MAKHKHSLKQIILRGYWEKTEDTHERETYEYHRPLLPAIITIVIAIAWTIFCLIMLGAEIVSK